MGRPIAQYRSWTMREWILISWLVGQAVFASLGVAQDLSTETPEAPEDPYLWLEDLKGEQALQWVADQNRRSTSHLESTAMFETLVRDAQVVLGSSAHLPLAEILADHAYGFWQDDRNPRDVWQMQTDSAMQIDHVVLATNHLASGVREFEEITGIKAVFGGSHPNGVTQNAIASFSGGIYVEILAPKDDLEAVPDFFKDFDRLTLIGFALSTPEIERVERTVRSLSFETNGIEDGSRTTPDGSLLSWRLLLINEPASFMNPFFITWSEDSEHPSKVQSPQGVLENLTLTTPHKRQIERILEKGGAEIPGLTIDEGARNLTIELETPNGTIKFDS